MTRKPLLVAFVLLACGPVVTPQDGTDDAHDEASSEATPDSCVPACAGAGTWQIVIDHRAVALALDEHGTPLVAIAPSDGGAALQRHDTATGALASTRRIGTHTLPLADFARSADASVLLYSADDGYVVEQLSSDATRALWSYDRGGITPYDGELFDVAVGDARDTWVTGRRTRDDGGQVFVDLYDADGDALGGMGIADDALVLEAAAIVGTFPGGRATTWMRIDEGASTVDWFVDFTAGEGGVVHTPTLSPQHSIAPIEMSPDRWLSVGAAADRLVMHLLERELATVATYEDALAPGELPSLVVGRRQGVAVLTERATHPGGHVLRTYDPAGHRTAEHELVAPFDAAGPGRPIGAALGEDGELYLLLEDVTHDDEAVAWLVRLDLD